MVRAVTEVSGGVRSAHALLRSPSSLVAVVVVGAAAVVFGGDLGTLDHQLVVCWSLLALTHLGLLATARSLAAEAITRVARWVWGAIAAAGLLYAIGDLVQLALLARGPVDLETGLGGPVQNALVLLGTAIPIGVVLRLTPVLGRRPRRPRARLALDIAIVTIAATVFGAYLTLPSSGSVSAALWLALLIGPGLFLSVVLGVVAISRSPRPPMSRFVASVVVVAATVEAIAQAGSTVLTRADHVAWNLGLTVLASALLQLAAGSQRSFPQLTGRRVVAGPVSLVSLVPSVALFATFALLLRVLVTQVSGVQQWAVVVGALLSAALVVSRQLVVISDNSRLVVQLDAKVEELNELLLERDRLAVALRHEATHDPLTGLANRSLLGTTLDEAIARLGERPGRITLMIIDLDDFKSVNDRFGHAAGDCVLRAVGARLRGCVRDHDLVARLGGDEFAVLVEDLPGADHDLARRIAATLREPIALDGGVVDSAASVGTMTTADPSCSAESLLSAADTAMYGAKRSRAGVGGNGRARELGSGVHGS